MNPWVALVLGLLIGWLVEWVIDWVYWRRRAGASSSDADCQERVARYKREIDDLHNDQSWLKEQIRVKDTEIESLRSQALAEPTRSAPVMDTSVAAMDTAVAAMEPAMVEDDLREIDGIDDTLWERLKAAGIATFAALGALRVPDLRRRIGTIPGAREADWIKQARIRSGTLTQVDDLVAVDGIGPVIARMLNDQGIFTFADVAALTPQDLRELLGERIERLANEEKILAHARQLAGL